MLPSSSSTYPRRTTSALEAVIDAALLLDPHDSMEYAAQLTQQELQDEILLQQQHQQLRRQLHQQQGERAVEAEDNDGNEDAGEAMPPAARVESDPQMLFQYQYKPTGIRGPKRSKRDRSPHKESKHGRWSTEEDMRLSEIIPRLGTQSWVDIAKELVDSMKKNHGQDPKGPQRTCKQCRQRWTNFLDPSVRRAQWTKEEDDKILEMVKLYGHKWSDISRQLNGRSEALVKNRWYSSVRKLAVFRTVTQISPNYS
jgi:myb proto-oncogene protein